MRLSMRLSLAVSIVACLGALACSSDESVVCERLAECDALPEGLSVSECEEDAVRQVPEERLSKCADCVEEKDCKNVVDGCRELCEPGD